MSLNPQTIPTPGTPPPAPTPGTSPGTSPSTPPPPPPLAWTLWCREIQC